MPRDDERSLHWLLAGGRLSGAERDEVLARVLAATDAAERPKAGAAVRAWWSNKVAIAMATLVPAAVAVVLVVGLRLAATTNAPAVAVAAGGDASEFRAKGALAAGGSAAAAAMARVLQAYCPARPAGRCRTGDKLIFEIDGPGAPGLLAAYADRPGGDRIWYFPTPSGHLAAVPASEGRAVVVAEAARLGDEHAVGRYAVHLFVLDKPVDRAALLAGQANARATSVVPIEVVP